MSVVEASSWSLSGDARLVPTAGKAIRAGAAR
jgi:hypothetical protein